MTYLSLSKSDLTYPHFTHTSGPRIVQIAKSISHDGLLNPIAVRPTADNSRPFEVIDGGKRLCALGLLERRKKLPRSLQLVPCVTGETAQSAAWQRPQLKSDAEFAALVRQAHTHGTEIKALMARLDCSETSVLHALSLERLHPQIFDYFSSGHLSLEQAAAFATLPHIEAQWALLQQLGPFAHHEAIIASILSGSTVVELPDGECIILPSRSSYKISKPAHIDKTTSWPKAA